MNIVWSPEALDDIGAAVDYLVGQRAAEAAARLVDRLTTLAEKLATEPIDGSEHVLSNGERVRGWPSPPFRIYYQRRSDALVILRVYHQRQLPITR